ncbi:porin OmpA [Cellvibrio zantedeschiae]|uniref:Porin OmpA n=1 Tax=Cellvibrio zantedeschiae TaxID=1237077 RepID=A0ABQ3ARN1_9GAMM|nr:outer membrane beta-barrel protein [Cellvibrio zantedeschiae]GGY61816.1 porin OmpA [Cellvibrio zantedeschiae]
MKFTKASNLLACALVAAAAASYATADESGWYLGGNIGETESDLDVERQADKLVPLGVTSTLNSLDDTDHGYKLYAGYKLNPYVALEGGYFDLGEFNFTNVASPAGSLSGKLELRGINLDLVLSVPLTEKLSGFARVGANYAEAQNNFGSTGFALAQTSEKDRDLNGKAGLGLQYNFNYNWAMRVEAERYRFDDGVSQMADANMYSVGLVYRFGSPTPPPAPVVIAPPAPAPVVAPPPPAPKFEKYTLSATELFTFDSAAVNVPQPKLQEIATVIKGPGAPEKIVITGYTDRLGSDEYNQKLSERRAQAVKDYIIGQGVAGERLVIEGKGEADPIVQCDDKNKAALIKCLAPNRRVEIDEVKIVRQVQP